jgi:hypothetical protein
MFLSTTQENKVFMLDGDRVPKAVACTERPLRIACEIGNDAGMAQSRRSIVAGYRLEAMLLYIPRKHSGLKITASLIKLALMRLRYGPATALRLP